MTAAQKARLDALQRMQKYLDDHAGVLGTISKSTSRTDLDAAVAALEQFGTQQEGAQVEATSRTKLTHDAREELRLHHMQPIAMIARKKLSQTGAIQDLALPQKSVSDQTLVQKGLAMVNVAAQYSQVFIDQQMPADFIAQLQAAVDAVKQAVLAQGVARALEVNGTKGVKAQLAVTRTDVKVINALVVKQLKGQANLLAEWVSVKRVRAKPGVPTGTTAPPAIVPNPAPVPAPSPTPVPAPAPTPPSGPVAAAKPAAPEVPQAA
jgi:hypothetical protein